MRLTRGVLIIVNRSCTQAIRLKLRAGYATKKNTASSAQLRCQALEGARRGDPSRVELVRMKASAWLQEAHGHYDRGGKGSATTNRNDVIDSSTERVRVAACSMLWLLTATTRGGA